MPVVSNLERRGAVYYWRRRVPPGLARATGLSHLRMSLRTREPRQARFLAAQMDAAAEDFLMSVDPSAITKEQLTELFRKAFESHSRKLALLADFGRQDPAIDPTLEAEDEQAMGWAYRILAKKGVGARIGEGENALMRSAGLTEHAIGSVATTLAEMQQDGRARPSQFKIGDLIASVGAEPSGANLARAEPVYLRALGEALLRTADRYANDPLPFGDLVAEITGLAAAPQTPVSPAVSVVEPPEATAPALVDVRPTAPDSSVPPPGPEVDDSVATIGARLVKDNRQDKVWDEKSCRQAEMIFDLFDRFMREECRITGLSQLKQLHLNAFDGFLRVLFKAYGKSPLDRERPIQELRQISEKKDASVRGLAGATRNRHFTFLGQLLRRARSSGVVMERDLAFTEYRAKKAKRGRNERAVPARATIGKLFEAPVFVGCTGWEGRRMHESGDLLYHRAAYFGPMLAIYQGMRREEFCGLAVDDVVTDNGSHPYLHVTFNAFRRLKNDQSVRNLALHPELIRLGFLDYVAAIRALGYERLFPDLFSPSSNSPLGDRLYDELLPAFRKAGLTTHQARHFFGNELKQKGVTAEFRADLLGHGGDTETTERYCDPVTIENQVPDLMKLPPSTTHLVPHPIRLLPWVERCETAPWSRARRRSSR